MVKFWQTFKYYLEMSIDRKGTSSRHWKDLRSDVAKKSFYKPKLMQAKDPTCGSQIVCRLVAEEASSKQESW